MSEAKVPENVGGCQDLAEGFGKEEDPQEWGGDALTPRALGWVSSLSLEILGLNYRLPDSGTW